MRAKSLQAIRRRMLRAFARSHIASLRPTVSLIDHAIMASADPSSPKEPEDPFADMVDATQSAGGKHFDLVLAVWTPSWFEVDLACAFMLSGSNVHVPSVSFPT